MAASAAISVKVTEEMYPSVVISLIDTQTSAVVDSITVDILLTSASLSVSIRILFPLHALRKIGSFLLVVASTARDHVSIV